MVLSLTKRQVNLIKEGYTEAYIEDNSKRISNQKELNTKLASLNEKMDKLEERFISGEISKEMYQKWSERYNPQLFYLKSEISYYNKDFDELDLDPLDWITNLKHVFDSIDTSAKQEMVQLIFGLDDLAYIKPKSRTSNHMFRTNYIHPFFLDKLSDNQCVILEKEKGKDARNYIFSLSTRSRKLPKVVRSNRHGRNGHWTCLPAGRF
jgi:hypothetical protein